MRGSGASGLACFSLRAKAVKIVFFKLKGQSLRDGMMCHLRASRLVLVTGGNLPFFVDSAGLDDVVGGYSDKNKKLRQAISIAVDMDEYVNIYIYKHICRCTCIYILFCRL